MRTASDLLLEPRTVIVGPPGSGKTTLLHWIANELMGSPDAAGTQHVPDPRPGTRHRRRPRSGGVAHAPAVSRQLGVRAHGLPLRHRHPRRVGPSAHRRHRRGRRPDRQGPGDGCGIGLRVGLPVGGDGPDDPPGRLPPRSPRAVLRRRDDRAIRRGRVPSSSRLGGASARRHGRTCRSGPSPTTSWGDSQPDWPIPDSEGDPGVEPGTFRGLPDSSSDPCCSRSSICSGLAAAASLRGGPRSMQL